MTQQSISVEVEGVTILTSIILIDQQAKSPKRKMRRAGCIVAVLIGFGLICRVLLFPSSNGTPCTAQMLSDLHNYPYKIIFHSIRDVGSTTFIMDADGKNVQPYTGSVEIGQPTAKGPYSAQLIYDQTGFQKYLIISDGFREWRVSSPETSVSAFAWSRSWDKVAYSTWGAKREIISVNADGTGSRVIFTGLLLVIENINSLDWSPDGQYIAFTYSRLLGRNNTKSGMDESSKEIYVARTDGTSACRLSPNETLDATFYDDMPKWVAAQ